MKLAPDKYLEKIANANKSNIEGFDKMIYDGYVYRSCDTITKHIKFVGEYRIYLTMIYFYGIHCEHCEGKKVKIHIHKGEISENNNQIFVAKLPNNFEYSFDNILKVIKSKNLELYEKINANI